MRQPAEMRFRAKPSSPDRMARFQTELFFAFLQGARVGNSAFRPKHPSRINPHSAFVYF